MAQIHAYVPDDVFERAKSLAKRQSMFLKAWVARAIDEQAKREEKKAGK